MTGPAPVPSLSELQAAIGRTPAWLVGGAVRDELLDRPLLDVDLAVGGDPMAAARAIGRAFGVPVFELSADFGTWRAGGGDWHADVSVLQGETIEDDLARRDLTVNAIARPLDGGAIVDPFGGLADLESRLLRMVSPAAFEDDPLRMLRVPRLASELGFTIDAETERAVTAGAGRISRSAGERVFTEIVRILASGDAVRGVRMLDRLALLDAVIPELARLKAVEQNRYHHLDAFEHTVSVLERAVEIEQDPAGMLPGLDAPDARAVAAHLRQPIADGVSRATALRIGALLHDIAKPQTQAVADDGTVLGFPNHAQEGVAVVGEICGRLRTSERLRSHLGVLTRHHLGLGFLVHVHPLDKRAIYRYLRATGDAALDVSLLSVADRLATRGHKAGESIARHLDVARQVLPAAVAWPEQAALAPLVRGDSLAAALGIAPGPRLGELLEAIAEARYTGEIETAAQAIEYARAYEPDTD